MSETKMELDEQERQRIMGSLAEVYDPEIPISIVDLGLVRRIELIDGEVNITMILTAPFCPLANMIIEQARAAAQAVSERPVRVVLGMERWDPSMMKQGS